MIIVSSWNRDLMLMLVSISTELTFNVYMEDPGFIALNSIDIWDVICALGKFIHYYLLLTYFIKR